MQFWEMPAQVKFQLRQTGPTKVLFGAFPCRRFPGMSPEIVAFLACPEIQNCCLITL